MGKELSKQTRNNWQIDALLLISAIIASLSGVYFLYFPLGYQGGRNPLYNATIIFNRQGWDLIHTLSGVTRIAVAAYHIIIHWKWITSMSRKVWLELLAGQSKLSKFGKFNVLINATIALTGLVTAISGVYFLFDTSNTHAVQPLFLFPRSTWDLIHTWAGVLMIISAVLHFAIHWKWVTKVTSRYFSIEKKQTNQPMTNEKPILVHSEANRTN